MKILLIYFFLWYSFLFASIEDSLTIDEAIREAIANNPSILEMKEQKDSSSWKPLEALSDHLPKLSIGGNYYMDAKYPRININFAGEQASIPTAFPQFLFVFQASINIFDGGGSIAKYRAWSYESQAKDLEYQNKVFLVKEQVKEDFYKSLAAQSLKIVADQNIKTLLDHLAIAKASLSSGFSTKVEVLRIEALLEEARAESLMAEDNVAITRDKLALDMGKVNDNRPLVGGLPDPIDMDFDEKSEDALMHRLDIQALLLYEKEKEELTWKAHSEYFPKISLVGQKQFYKYGDFDPIIIPNATFQNAYSVGFMMVWNIFDGGSSIARSFQAIHDKRSDQEKLQKSILTIPYEYKEWIRRYKYNLLLFKARKRTIELSKESVRLSVLGLRSGTRTNSEVLDAELELFKARAGLIQSKIDGLSALIKIERITGSTLRQEY